MSTICICFYILTKLDDGGVFFISQCFKRQSSLSSSENPVIYREVKKKKRKFPCCSILFLFLLALISYNAVFFFLLNLSLFSFCIFFVGQPASNSTRNLMIYLQLRAFLSLLYNTVFIYSPKTSCSVCMLSQNLCYLHSAKFLMATIFKVHADFKAYSNVCLQHL